jgi:hypothetical protein
MLTTRRGRERQREFFTGRPVSSLLPGELAAAHTAGYEAGTDGRLIGRDPRAMTPDALRAMGHMPMSPMEAIRVKCLDCCGGSADEVRKCVAMTCANWPFRTGKNPWRAPASEAQREAARRMAARMHQKSSGPGRMPVFSDEPPAGVLGHTAIARAST